MVGKNLSLAILVLVILTSAIEANPPKKVTVPAGKHFLTIASTVPSLPGILHKPDGKGPFPAVVMLCGCSGYANAPDMTRYSNWAERLASWGYVALLLDSFTPRGFPNGICEYSGVVGSYDRANDAYAGKLYLSKLSFVDFKNIFVIGWSHGGDGVLNIIDKTHRDKNVEPFKAGVAFYPYCTPPLEPDTPILVLIGAKDDWCPDSMAKGTKNVYISKNWKPEFALTIYPNAYHRFDDETLKTGIMFFGHHLQYDPEAITDAIPRMKGFLDKYLRTSISSRP